MLYGVCVPGGLYPSNPYNVPCSLGLVFWTKQRERRVGAREEVMGEKGYWKLGSPLHLARLAGKFPVGDKGS